MNQKRGIPYYMQKFRFFATVLVFLLFFGINLPGPTAEAGARVDGAALSGFEAPALPAVKTDPNTVTHVLVGGDGVALRLTGDGVTVLGYTDDGKDNPAKIAGLKPGDRITAMGGVKIDCNEGVTECLNQCNGGELSVTYVRKNKEFSAKITPRREENGTWQLGILIKDSTAGIGTLTYILPTGEYGCLGHGISDPDTEQLFCLGGGEIFPAQITGVRKGTAGAPGELQGMFLDPPLGNCQSNGDTGVFGVLDTTRMTGRDLLPIASKSEVKEGPAVIRCTVDEEGIREYNIEIVRIYRTFSGATKNMVIRVTDSALLGKTGGIVQGMSGSPILQNGKLVGAVTHVLVNDPTSGYGIFIENMLQAEQQNAA